MSEYCEDDLGLQKPGHAFTDNERLIAQCNLTQKWVMRNLGRELRSNVYAGKKDQEEEQKFNEWVSLYALRFSGIWANQSLWNHRKRTIENIEKILYDN